MSHIHHIALIGFGEVGQVLSSDLTPTGVILTAFDPLFADNNSVPAKALLRHTVKKGKTAAEASHAADLIISAVTAAQDLEAAQSVMGGLKSGAYFLDLNSASPGTKQQAAKIIESGGGRYVEAAVMSPISPKRLASPILIGGPHAQAFLPLAHNLGFTGMSFLSKDVGPASATKMCRSVIVKGIEALLTESLLAARHYGVEASVLSSLSDLFPGNNWPELARYMISRALKHGTRRAEEMREAARTVTEAGIQPIMSVACADKQDWSAQFSTASDANSLGTILDEIREKTTRKNNEMAIS